MCIRDRRYSLAAARIREIGAELEQKKQDGTAVPDELPWMDYFNLLAEWMTVLDDFKIWQESHEFNEWSLEEWQDFYEMCIRDRSAREPSLTTG